MHSNDTGEARSGSEERGERLLEQLAASYADRLIAGEELAPSEVLAAHPTLGPEILAHLEAFVRCSVPGAATARCGRLGDYVLLREIGRGGMGVVYEAWQATLDRQVALKVLRGGLLADLRAVARFEREAKLAGKLHHPNIVAVHGFGVDDNTPYYAMELVEGETLARLLARARGGEEGSSASAGTDSLAALSESFRVAGAAAPPAEAPAGLEPEPRRSARALEVDVRYALDIAEAFAGAAEGLHHAHSWGVVHRDIKPSNLMVARDGRLRLLDFGLARHEDLEALTISGELVGTPLYMSPEQARPGEAAEYRSDIYSLGATLYEALALRPPLSGRDHRQTLALIADAEPAPLRRLNPRIPADLETIVHKCLRKSPAERYRTAEALAQDLRRFVRGDPIEARPQGGLEKLRRRLRRHRAAALVSAALLVAAAATGLLLRSQLAAGRAERERLYAEKVMAAVTRLELAQEVPEAMRPDGAAVGPALVLEGRQAAPAGELSTEGSDEGAGAREGPSAPAREAAAELEAAAALFPRRPDALYHLARAYLLLGDAERARGALRRCPPGFVPRAVLEAELAWRERGEAPEETGGKEAGELQGEGWESAWRRARQAESRRQWGEAAAAAGELAALAREGEGYLGLELEARLGRGRALLQARDFDGALEEFTAAAALWPKLPGPALLQAMAYRRLGKPERAEAIFHRIYAEAARPDEAVLGALRILHGLEDWERGLAWAERLLDPALRARERADFLRYLKRFDEALEAAREAVKLGPRDAGAAYQMGSLLLELGGAENEEEARRWLGEAGRLEPYHVRAWKKLADSLAKSGDAEGAQRLWAESIRGLYIDAGQFHADRQSTLGKQLARLGQYEAAVRLWEEASRSRYADAWTLHFERGRFREAMREYEGALADYEEALRLAPAPWAEPHSRIAGICCYRLRRYARGLQAIDEAIRLDPGNIGYYKLRHDLLIRTGTGGEARRGEDLALILQHEPSNGQAHNALGNLLCEQGQFQAAIEHFSRAIEISPDYMGYYLNRANARTEIDFLDPRVLEDTNRAIELNPALSEAWNNRGITWLQRREDERALEDLSLAVSLRPDDDSQLYWRIVALCRLRLGRQALEDLEDLEDLERALKLRPRRQGEISALRAWAWEVEGDLERAEAEYDRSLASDPGQERIYAHRGRIRALRGDLQGAMDDAERAFQAFSKAEDGGASTRPAVEPLYETEGGVVSGIRPGRDCGEIYDAAVLQALVSQALAPIEGRAWEAETHAARALGLLAQALEAQAAWRWQLPDPRDDEHLAALRCDPRFEALLARWPEPPALCPDLLERSDALVEIGRAQARRRCGSGGDARVSEGEERLAAGDSAGAQEEFTRAIRLNQEAFFHGRVPIVLRPGGNLIQFKVFQGNRGWGLRARLEKPGSGEALLGGRGEVEVCASMQGEAPIASAGGFFRRYLVLGPYANPGGPAPGEEAIRRDYLVDGEVSEATIEPAAGLLLKLPAGSEAEPPGYLGEGLPTIRAVDVGGTDLDLVACLTPQEKVMAYAWVHVRNLTGADLALDLALAADDSLEVQVNREVVATWNVWRGLPAVRFDAAAYLGRARARMALGELEAALEDLEMAGDCAGLRAEVLALEGECRLRLGQLEAGLAAFKRARAAAPLSWMAHVASGAPQRLKARSGAPDLYRAAAMRALGSRLASGAEGKEGEAAEHRVRALELLEEALSAAAEGAKVPDPRGDPDFEVLHREPRFEELLARWPREPGPAAEGEAEAALEQRRK